MMRNALLLICSSLLISSYAGGETFDGPTQLTMKFFDSLEIKGPAQLRLVKAQTLEVKGDLQFHSLDVAKNANITGSV